MKKYITESDPEVLKSRIAAALEESINGQCDGAHHKAYSIDQMVRILLGCQKVTDMAETVHGKTCLVLRRAPNDEYLRFIEDWEDPDPETGEKFYEWDCGIC